tara:strand:- start:1405 stop:1563 length:159 start_codon:yes stop_codon:yes gene_type:complete
MQSFCRTRTAEIKNFFYATTTGENDKRSATNSLSQWNQSMMGDVFSLKVFEL